MSDIAIRVEHLSKQYPSTPLRTSPSTKLRAGRSGGPQARYKTLRDTLTGAFTAPFRHLSSVVRGQSSAVSNETIWALKDVSFEACPEPVEGSSAVRWWARWRPAAPSGATTRTGWQQQCWG
jgi:hypothetical protein